MNNFAIHDRYTFDWPNWWLTMMMVCSTHGVSYDTKVYSTCLLLFFRRWFLCSTKCSIKVGEKKTHEWFNNYNAWEDIYIFEKTYSIEMEAFQRKRINHILHSFLPITNQHHHYKRSQQHHNERVTTFAMACVLDTQTHIHYRQIKIHFFILSTWFFFHTIFPHISIFVKFSFTFHLSKCIHWSLNWKKIERKKNGSVCNDISHSIQFGMYLNQYQQSDDDDNDDPNPKDRQIVFVK